MPSQIYSPTYPSASHSENSYYINVSWSFPSGTSVAKVKILDYNTGVELYNSGLLSQYTSSRSCYISSPQWGVYGLYCVSVQYFNYNTGDFSAWSNDVYGFNRVTMTRTPTPSPPSNVSASYSGLNATITWSKGSYASYTAITFNGQTYYPTGTSLVVTLPAKGIYYDITLASVNVNNEYSSWIYGGALYVAPAPAPSAPTNVSVSYSGMVATITWTKGTNTSYTDVHNMSDGTHGTPTGNTWTFNVPSKGVSYSFRLASVNVDGVSSSWVDVPIIFIPARPTSFVGNLYKTATDGNDVIDTSQWHAFATKINQFRAYKGLVQHTYVYLTNAQNGNNFLAIYFNEMINSMSGLGLSGLYEKSAGSSILKSYFDDMVTKLNSIV